MRFPFALLRLEANVRKAKHCAALVKVLIKVGRLFVIILFVFTCFYS